MDLELLSPAGTLKSLRYAFAYGADAVYAGQPRYSLRVRNNDFNHLNLLAEGIEVAHEQGKLFYLASNLAPHNDKVRSYLRDMEAVIGMGPDALIMSDPGLIMLVRQRWPQMPIHLSVQANVVNYASVEFWQRQGITRIILSRELSLEEIAEIRQRCPEVELEVFVHGALCIAYSGRCLLSGYMRHRDSNQGACSNSCRWRYQLHEAEQTDNGDIIPTANVDSDDGERVFLLQEQQRPGELMPVYEDEHGTYIMNSKDLRAVQHVQQLQQMGIESIKIEGRTKSHYYVARTTQIYRQAIEDARAGNDSSLALMDKLESLANRGYTEGFYRRHVPDELQNYVKGSSDSDRQRFVGEVVSAESDERSLLIDVKNRFTIGDRLELMSPRGSVDFTLEEIESEKGGSVSTAPGSGHRVRILNPGIQPDYGLLVRYLPEEEAG